MGMVVTALLMGVAGEHKIPLSDAEIRAKALELGMVESDSLRLTDISNNSPMPSETLSPAQDAALESEPDSGSLNEQEPEDGEEGAEDSTEKSAEIQGTVAQPENPAAGSEADQLAESDQAPENGDMVTVVIEAGVTSYRISSMLAELGLVEDAAEFDTYLCDNGYSTKINYGTYEIPMGASEEEIAKIITRNR